MYTQADIENLDILINTLKQYKSNMQKYIQASSATFNDWKPLNRSGMRWGKATSLMAKQDAVYSVMQTQEEQITKHIHSFFM